MTRLILRQNEPRAAMALELATAACASLKISLSLKFEQTVHPILSNPGYFYGLLGVCRV